MTAKRVVHNRQRSQKQLLISQERPTGGLKCMRTIWRPGLRLGPCSCWDHTALPDHLAGWEEACCSLSKNPHPRSPPFGPGYLTPVCFLHLHLKVSFGRFTQSIVSCSSRIQDDLTFWYRRNQGAAEILAVGMVKVVVTSLKWVITITRRELNTPHTFNKAQQSTLFSQPLAKSDF